MFKNVFYNAHGEEYTSIIKLTVKYSLENSTFFCPFRIIAKSAYWLRHVCPPFCLSLRMYQPSFHWTHLRQI